MFLWLFNNKRKIDIYYPKERLIYSYFNGEQTIKEDPMILWKKLMDHGPSLSIDIKVSKSPSKDAVKAHTNLVKTIREVFNVKSLCDNGLTEVETTDLLDHFMEYCDQLKKNSSQLQTQSTPLVGSNNTSKEDPPTQASLDFGSTENEFNTDVPEPLLSEQELQTDQ